LHATLHNHQTCLQYRKGFPSSHHRSLLEVGVWTTAFVSVAEEFIIVAILLIAGFMIEKKLTADEERVEMIGQDEALERSGSVEMAGTSTGSK